MSTFSIWFMQAKYDGRFRRCLTLVLWVLAASSAIPVSGLAQTDYPTRPITLIVSFGAGGSTDVVARALAEEMKVVLGQPVIVETRPGASGNIGALYVARKPPDGYTLLVAAGAHAAAAKLPTAKHDLIADFTPVRQFVSSSYVLVSRKNLGVSNVRELIELARSRPGQISLASSGFGASPHLAGVLLQQLSDIQLNHVPFNGDTQVTAALLGEHVDVSMVAISNTKNLIDEGALIALGVSDARRSDLLPQTPTLAEAGVAGYELTTWFGLVGPKGMDERIVKKLDEAVSVALRSPTLQKLFKELGFSIVDRGPDKFPSFIKSEVERYDAIMRAAGGTEK